MSEADTKKPWRYEHIEFPTGLVIPQLIEQQVALHPDKVALIFRDQKMTYRELNEKANKLARYLVSLGLGPEKTAVVCMERSLDIYIGFLAIQKAGGAYVPLEPSNPTNRLEYLFEDSNPVAILTQEPILSHLPQTERTIFCIDKDWNLVENESADNIPQTANENNLSDIIYTSGSTGMPKGVMSMHKNRVNQLFAWKHAYSLSEKEVLFQTTSVGFDVFTGDYTRSLCLGATLVPCPRNIALLPETPVEEFYTTMKKEGVTFVEFHPHILRKVFRYAKENELPLSFLKYIVVGSDAWFMSEFKELMAYCGPDTRHINSYGMTEAAVDSTYFESTMVNNFNDPRYESSSPIGRPFPNTKVYLLDDNLQQVAKGDVGVMYFGGPNTARGYLNREELTKERFIQNPFSDEPRDILYKSGDLARVNEDDILEFYGRGDFQFKIGSKRVEVGEIEAAILSHPSVDETVVMGVRAEDKDTRIVCYVSFKKGKEISIDELKTFLKDSVPAYMIPQYIVVIDTFPRNTNGKVDRKQLPPVEIK